MGIADLDIPVPPTGSGCGCLSDRSRDMNDG